MGDRGGDNLKETGHGEEVVNVLQDVNDVLHVLMDEKLSGNIRNQSTASAEVGKLSESWRDDA